MKRWQPLAVYGAMALVLLAGLYWRLGSLLPGYSQSELGTYNAGMSLHNILHSPLNAPFLLLTKGLSYALPHNLVAGRLAATLCGVVVLLLFAALLDRWHNMRTAILGTILFGLSASFLHVSRAGTPEVLLFGLFVLTACGFWLKQTNHWLALLVCFILTACLVYVPGMLWFIVAGLLWQWKTIDQVFKKHLLTVTIGTLALLAALVPLGWDVYKDHGLIRPLLGLPAQWPTISAMIRNLLNVPFHLFIHNDVNPVAWLGTAPILDAFSLTMFVLGGYLYLRNIKLIRTPLFLTLLIAMAALIAVGGSITLTIIMPFVYLVIAAGIAYLTDQWFKVFPRNPIARSIGWVSVIILVAIACGYQLTHYFVGWPEATATHQVFTVENPAQTTGQVL